MMKLRKKALALAMSAAVLGGGASLAQAQTVNPGGLGQALIYPYLTANNGWSTFLHVINTSPATVAAKVRFRTATDSSDAYDLIVVLSPFDIWTTVVEQQGGQSGFRPTDNSCTVPYFGKDKFVPFIVQSSEVYAEVIEMGVSVGLSSSNNPIAVAAKHSATTGLPANCAAVEAGFANPGSLSAMTEFDNSLNTTFTVGATDYRNILTGKYDLVNVSKGQSGAGRATAIADFGAPAANGSFFLETNMWSQSPGDWDHPTLAEANAGLTAINDILAKTALVNEWVLNPNLGELSSWVVTFPTKKHYVDAIAPINASTVQVTKLVSFGNAAGKPSCVEGTPSVFNREEKQIVSGSPGTTQLCNEVNVINFKNSSADSKTVLESNVAVTIDTTNLGGTGVQAGWMSFAMPSTTATALQSGLPQTTITALWNPPTAPAPPVAVAASALGRPAIGFNFTARATPADAVLYDHAYTPPSP